MLYASLMSWTRLDDDRTIHAATEPRIKACSVGELSHLAAQRHILVRDEEREFGVRERSE